MEDNDTFKEEITRASDIIKNGGTILYPTDTIWGIGCDATNETAVSKIYEIKKRDERKSMIILLDQDHKLYDYVKDVPPIAHDLIDVAEKPLTIIYSGAINLAKNVIAEDGTIAIRVTKDPFCKALIQRIRKPLVSTSANLSGDAHPKNYGEINEAILSNVDYIVNLRRSESSGTPSSIIKLGASGEVEVIRK